MRSFPGGVCGIWAQRSKAQRCRALLLSICLILFVRILHAEPPASSEPERWVLNGLTLVPDLPVGSAGAAYHGSFTPKGGKAPFSFMIVNGKLPAGLSLSPTTGKVTGTPHSAGVAHFELFARDSEFRFTLLSTQITVDSRVASSVSVSISPSSGSMPSGESRQFDAIVKGTSNTGVAWSVSAGSISKTGMFTAPPVKQTTNVAVTATSLADKTKKASATIAVSAPVPVSIPAENCPNGTDGTTYTGCTIPARNGVAQYSWTLNGGSLPSGLTLRTTGNQAVISGTPTAPGTFHFVLKVADSTHPTPATASVPLSITVNLNGQLCGYPTFNCARTDRNTLVLSSTGTVPPDAGAHRCAAGKLESCGNSLGLNTMMTDPAFNNVKIVRVSDFGDEESGCSPMAGPGGSSEENIFEKGANYLTLQCTDGFSRIKWFNPSTMQIVETVDPQGYVRTSTGEIFQTGDGLQFAYKTPGQLFAWHGTQIQSYQMASGLIGSPTTISDFTYAIPCWSKSTGLCGDWKTGTYPPGANLIPQRSNSLSHVFQLLNASSCATGTPYPEFGGNVAANEMAVIRDGDCQWVDIGPADNVMWKAASGNSHDDLRFTAAFNNYQGQGAPGACFLVQYDSTANAYYHLNTCTGNAYKTTCIRGTGYTCAGGTWGQSFIANVVPSTQSLATIHNAKTGGDGTWISITNSGCALGTVRCPSVPGSRGGASIEDFWQAGTSTMTFFNTLTGAIATGHSATGYKHFVGIWNPVLSDANKYFKILDMAGGKDDQGNDYEGLWDLTSGPPCSPNACPNSYLFDQHPSWTANTGSDTSPVCTFVRPGSESAGTGQWPPQYPWLGEIDCFATDGSNSIWRQAYTYNTIANGIFNVWADIMGWSSDGNWVAFNSDWFCTLGSTSGEQTNMCGLPYQASHNYAARGELVAPNNESLLGPIGYVFQVTTTGTSGSDYPAWCQTVGCTVTSGGVKFRNVGAYTAQSAVFVLRLQ